MTDLKDAFDFQRRDSFINLKFPEFRKKGANSDIKVFSPNFLAQRLIIVYSVASSLSLSVCKDVFFCFLGCSLTILRTPFLFHHVVRKGKTCAKKLSFVIFSIVFSFKKLKKGKHRMFLTLSEGIIGISKNCNECIIESCRSEQKH